MKIESPCCGARLVANYDEETCGVYLYCAECFDGTDEPMATSFQLKEWADLVEVDRFNAISLGRKGGKIGGPARARSLTSGQRSRIAKKAAQARWAKKRLREQNIITGEEGK